MTAVLNDFIDLLVGGLTHIGEGFGTGINDIATSMFLQKSSSGAVEGLSTFGGLIAVFAGIGLAVGACTLIFNWVRSIGN